MAGEERKDMLMDALACYIEMRVERPKGDYTRAITALHKMDGEEKETISKTVVPSPVGEAIVQPQLAKKKIPSIVERILRGKDEPVSVPTIDKELIVDPRISEPVETTSTSSSTQSVSAISVPKKPITKPLVSETVPSPITAPQVSPTTTENTSTSSEDPHSNSRSRNTKGPSGIECKGCGLPVKKSKVEGCSSCAVDICPACGEYEKVHRDSRVFYDYRFDYPLCKECYLNSYKVQEEMGRASTYFGTGNMTYSGRHAKKAVELASSWEGGAMYMQRAEALVDAVDRARSGMAGRSKSNSWKSQSGDERRERPTSKDVEGDKWAKRFVERALSR